MPEIKTYGRFASGADEPLEQYKADEMRQHDGIVELYVLGRENLEMEVGTLELSAVIVLARGESIRRYWREWHSREGEEWIGPMDERQSDIQDKRREQESLEREREREEEERKRKKSREAIARWQEGREGQRE